MKRPIKENIGKPCKVIGGLYVTAKAKDKGLTIIAMDEDTYLVEGFTSEYHNGLYKSLIHGRQGTNNDCLWLYPMSLEISDIDVDIDRSNDDNLFNIDEL